VDLVDARRRRAKLRELVANALRRARRLAFDLRPTVLEDIGLPPALERLTAEVAERTGLTVELDVGLGADERLAPETKTAVYRVVQEALTNVARHAGASHVSVTLARLGDRVRAHRRRRRRFRLGQPFASWASRPRRHGRAGPPRRPKIS